MESGFTSGSFEYSDSTWQPIPHRGSGRFEFFKVRLFGALHFVKRPSASYANDLQTTESLRKEFNLGYNLSHPSIVKYLRMENGAVFQEYIDGVSLQQMIDMRDERLSSSGFLQNVCKQLLEATAYLHSNGIIHNDIKPDNIMVTRIGDQVKLVDLGCASSDMWDATQGYTKSCKAPEQGVAATNVYTDIFLVGKVMEQLASNAGLRRSWDDFIKKATSPNFSCRYSSDKEALDAIPNEEERIGCSGLVSSLILIAVVIIGGGNIFSFLREWGTMLYEKTIVYVSRYGWGTGLILIAIVIIGCNSIISYFRRRGNIKHSKGVSNDGKHNSSGVRVVGTEMNDVKTHQITTYMDETWKNEGKVYITDKLTDYIITQYEQRLFPLCIKFADMSAGRERGELGQHIDLIKDKMVDDILVIAEDLAHRFPELSVFVANQTYAILEQQQLKAERLKHPNEQS